MVDKYEAYLQLLDDYTDGDCAITWRSLAAISNGADRGQNPHLFTGTGNILLSLSDIIRISNSEGSIFTTQRSNFEYYVSKTQVVPGLHQREPEPYLNTSRYDAISIDEHNGIIFSLCAFNLAGGKLSQEMYQYAQRNGYAFYEKEPNGGAWPKSLAEWKSLYSTLKDLYKISKKLGDWDGGTAQDKIIFENKVAVRMSRIRMPKDRFFINVAARQRAGILNTIHFILSAIDTARKPREKRSGKIMLFFKLKCLQMLGFRNFMWKMLYKYVDKKLRKDYGFEYMIELFKLFYEDRNHPFFTLAQGISSLELSDEA